MHKDLVQLAEATASASHLSRAEKEELTKELLSHFFEQEYEMNLQGNREEQNVKKIKASFGNPDEIGKQLHMVHQRYEKIPLIGPLFYYRPVVTAFKLFFAQLFGWLLLTVIIWLMKDGFASAPPLLTTLIKTIPYLSGIGAGIWLSKQKLSWAEMLDALFLSLLPLCLAGLVVLYGTGYLDTSAGSLLGSLAVFAGGASFFALLYGSMLVFCVLMGTILTLWLMNGNLQTPKPAKIPHEGKLRVSLWASMGLAALTILLLLQMPRLFQGQSAEYFFTDPAELNLPSDVEQYYTLKPLLLEPQWRYGEDAIKPSPGMNKLTNLYALPKILLKEGSFQLYAFPDQTKRYLFSTNGDSLLLEEVADKKIVTLSPVPTSLPDVMVVTLSPDGLYLFVQTRGIDPEIREQQFLVYDVANNTWSRDFSAELPRTIVDSCYTDAAIGWSSDNTLLISTHADLRLRNAFHTYQPGSGILQSNSNPERQLPPYLTMPVLNTYYSVKNYYDLPPGETFYGPTINDSVTQYGNDFAPKLDSLGGWSEFALDLPAALVSMTLNHIQNNLPSVYFYLNYPNHKIDDLSGSVNLFGQHTLYFRDPLSQQTKPVLKTNSAYGFGLSFAPIQGTDHHFMFRSYDLGTGILDARSGKLAILLDVTELQQELGTDSYFDVVSID